MSLLKLHLNKDIKFTLNSDVDTVIVDFKASGVIFRLIFEGTTSEIYDAFTSRIKVQMINGVFDDKGLTIYDVAFLVTASAKASGLEPSRADFFNAS